MRFGRTVPKGFLPIFSVDTAEEAEKLIVLTCPMNLAGEYVAPELAVKQTLDGLYAFGDRLRDAYERMKRTKRRPRKNLVYPRDAAADGPYAAPAKKNRSRRPA